MSLRTLTGTGLLAAGLLPAQSASDLTRVLDQYLASVKARSFDRILSLYHAPAKKAVLADFKTPEERKEFLDAIAEMAPDSYDSPEVVRGGDRLLLRIQAKKNVPLKVQKENNLPPVVQRPMTVDFIQESGQWKMGPPSLSAQAEEAPAPGPADLDMGVRADYQEAANTQLGGPVLRMETRDEGAVCVIRVVDESIAVFVPSKLAPAGLETGRILAVQGAAHRKDPRKFWAETARLHQP